MRILIVEDDNYKFLALNYWLDVEYQDVDVSIQRSYRDGCIAALKEDFDLLILDMALPARFQLSGSAGETIVNGGELIIRELLDEQIEFMAVILTQYETFNGETIEAIDQRLKQMCGKNFLGCICYNSQDDSWKNNLKMIIDDVKGFNC